MADLALTPVELCYRDSVHAGECMYGVGSTGCQRPPTMFCAGPMSSHHWPGWCDLHALNCRGHEHFRLSDPIADAFGTGTHQITVKGSKGK